MIFTGLPPEKIPADALVVAESILGKSTNILYEDWLDSDHYHICFLLQIKIYICIKYIISIIL